MTSETLAELRTILEEATAVHAIGLLTRHDRDLCLSIQTRLDVHGRAARITVAELQRMRDIRERVS